MNRRVLGHAALYSLGEIVPKAVRILLLPVFTRYLVPEEYGILAYTSAVMAFLFSVSTLSLNTYVIRFYFDFAPEDEASRRKLIGNVFVFLALFNALLTGLAILIGPWILGASGVSIPFFPYFLMALGTNFFNVLSVIPLAAYRIKKQAGKFVLLSVSQAVLQTVVSLVLVVGFGVGLIGMYWSSLCVGASFAGIYFFVIYRHGTFTLDLRQIGRGLAFAVPIIPATISYLVIDMVDRIMLETHVALDRLGLYSVAYTLGFGMTVVIQGGYRAFEPELFQHYTRPDFPAIYDRIKRTFMFVVLVAGTALALFSPEVIALMTAPKFHEADTIVPIVVLAACLRAVGILYSVMLVAYKKTTVNTAIVIVAATVNILANLVLIPSLGIIGAAWSTVLSFAVLAPLSYIICERSGILRVRGLLVKDALAFLVAILAVWGTVYAWRPEGFVWSIVVKGALWLAVIGLLGAIYGIWRDLPRLLSRRSKADGGSS